MVDLFDRLFPANDGADNIAVHLFEAALVKYVKGTYTQAQIVAALSFDSEAQTDFTFIINQINSLTGLGNKLDYIQDVMATVNITAHGFGFLTKAAFKTEIGL